MNIEFFTEGRPLEQIYWICAAVGTLFFLLRTIMMVVGGDVDVDGDGDIDVNLDDTGHAFELISINSITAFVMMFGWAGLTAYKQFNLGSTQSLITSFIVGVICMLITAYLFQLAKTFVSRGTQFKIANTVGLNGVVQQVIPNEGVGRVTVTLDGMARELNAVSGDNVEIPSFVQVSVEKVVNSNTVAVKKLS